MAKKKVRPARKVRRATKSDFVGEAPTLELQRHRPFAIEPVVEDGQVTGRSYRRQPLYVTLSKTSDKLTAAELQALDLYRETHDRADRSFTKSCLDFDSGSFKPDAIVHVHHVVREAREQITSFEAAVGPIVDTLRAVALEDRSFSEIAMERFGSRKQSWILVDEPVIQNGVPVMKDGKQVRHTVEREKLVPRSNRHREIIRFEYREAVTLLTAAIRAKIAPPAPEEIWVSPLSSGRARISRGPMGPKSAYRMRGPYHAIGATVAALARGMESELEFPSYRAAKEALIEASAGRLVDVDAPPAPAPGPIEAATLPAIAVRSDLSPAAESSFGRH